MLVISVLGLALFIASIVTTIAFKKKWPLIGALAGFVVFMLGCSFVFVPTGYVGVRTAYGQISEKPTKSGLNRITPFVEQIHNVNCKQQEMNYGDLQIWSETSERTEIYCQNVVIDYQIDAEWAAWIWANVEEYDHNLVKQTTVESGIKAATKQYDDTDVTDRSKIEKTAKEMVQDALNSKYGNQIVTIVSVTIGNMNFSDAYNEAIEKKSQARLAAETAEYVNNQATQQVKAEAEQKRIQAAAEAEAAKVKAEGEAESLRIRAEAEAEANDMIAKSLTPELIESQKIEKWDGKLPSIQGSAGTIIDFKGGQEE